MHEYMQTKLRHQSSHFCRTPNPNGHQQLNIHHPSWQLRNIVIGYG